jgi:hypothetical protein
LPPAIQQDSIVDGLCRQVLEELAGRDEVDDCRCGLVSLAEHDVRGEHRSDGVAVALQAATRADVHALRQDLRDALTAEAVLR